MVSAQLCRLANLILVFLAFILYVTSFSSTGWLEDDYYAYGLWKKCDKNQTETDVCVTIGLANQEDYFEASRSLATLALITFICCLATCFIEENDRDDEMKKKCFRYMHCMFTLVTEILLVIALAVLGAGYEDDPMLKDPELDWCFSLTIAVTVLLIISFMFRFTAIAKEHNIAPSCSCCFNCKMRSARTKPAAGKKSMHVMWSEASFTSGDDKSKVPPKETRRASADGQMEKLPPTDDRIFALPPLPPVSPARGNGGSRSSDSGMDSRDVSRDSTTDELTGPVPLSVEMLKKHDRRLNCATGRRDDRRRHLAFSSTTTLSSSDSQSSAELAPRVHTPTNQKRVHYDIPDNPPTSSVSSSVPPPPPPPPVYQDALAVGGDGDHAAVAPPIISFPIKIQGIELSRAKTNSRTTATIDNVKLMTRSVRRWQREARKMSQERMQVDSLEKDSGSRSAAGKKMKKSKKKKKKKEEEGHSS